MFAEMMQRVFSGAQLRDTSPTEHRGLSVGTGVMAGSVTLSIIVGSPCSSRYVSQRSMHFEVPIVQFGDGLAKAALLLVENVQISVVYSIYVLCSISQVHDQKEINLLTRQIDSLRLLSVLHGRVGYHRWLCTHQRCRMSR